MAGIIFPPEIPSGKRLHFANLNMAIEIVDLPWKMRIFHSYVKVYQRVTAISMWKSSPPVRTLRLACIFAPSSRESTAARLQVETLSPGSEAQTDGHMGMDQYL